MYLLSFCLLYANILIKECNMSFDLPFMLQSWCLILWEGQRLGVFNSSVVRKLGPNVHEVMGRLVTLRNSFVASLNRMVCFDQMMTLQY